MVRVPVPSSTWSRLKSILGGSIFEIVWIALVTAVLVLVFYVLVSLGPLGGVIAFILAASLLSESVRKAVKDIYRRDFAEI